MEKAERVLKEELKKLAWSLAEWGRRKKGDPAKVKIAGRLRLKTTMTLQ